MWMKPAADSRSCKPCRIKQSF